VHTEMDSLTAPPPEDFVEAAVRTVLTAADDVVDVEIGQAALLAFCVGAAEHGDRLVRHWRHTTGRSVTRLVRRPVAARAWAMLLSGRRAPDWAGELPPLDLDAEERAHRAHLARLRATSGVDAVLADLVDRAWTQAEAGAIADARATIDAWAEHARAIPRPDLATLAGARPLARLLADGALTVPAGWTDHYVTALVAALTTRYRTDTTRSTDGSWRELIDDVLWLRGTPGAAPPPAPARDIAEAEHRLGRALPDGYRRFLATCDGLPADVVFPRLLSASELTTLVVGPDGTPGCLVISEPATLVLRTGTGEVVEDDPVFGISVHQDVAALLDHHRELLRAAGTSDL
jgi:hypothetical protein